jgi:hypothetical protein
LLPLAKTLDILKDNPPDLSVKPWTFSKTKLRLPATEKALDDPLFEECQGLELTSSRFAGLLSVAVFNCELKT